MSATSGAPLGRGEGVGAMPGDVRNAALFSALALALSVAVVLLVPAPTDIVIMSAPTIAALVMMLVVTREGYTRAGWASWDSIALPSDGGRWRRSGPPSSASLPSPRRCSSVRRRSACPGSSRHRPTCRCY